MQWSGRHVALAMAAGAGGGVLAVVLVSVVLGLPLWQPIRFGVGLVAGAGIGWLCAWFVRPSDS
jgi:hypothetical protein